MKSAEIASLESSQVPLSQRDRCIEAKEVGQKHDPQRPTMTFRSFWTPLLKSKCL